VNRSFTRPANRTPATRTLDRALQRYGDATELRKKPIDEARLRRARAAERKADAENLDRVLAKRVMQPPGRR
jgi:hypothetical protein